MSIASEIPAAHRELSSILGQEFVCAGDSECAIDGVVPGLVVDPKDAEQVTEIVRFANANKLNVVPSGGFSHQHIGRSPERIDVLLKLGRLNQVEHYDPGDLTIGLQAGMRISDAQRLLEANDQMLPLDVGNPARATIGGVLAVAGHGPMRAGYGGVRDFCIGIRFVTGDGTLAGAGGRVVKNVAGYDLMKLLIGSYGSLAVIVSANFKVFPRPRRLQTFVLKFKNLREAMERRDELRRTALSPICFEIVSPNAREFLAEARDARDPDDLLPIALTGQSEEWWLCLRATGSEAVLARYSRGVGPNFSEEESSGREPLLWQYLSKFAQSVRERHRNAMIFSVSAPIQSMEQAILVAEKTALDYSFIPAVVGRVSLGALIIAFLPFTVDPPAAMHYAKAASGLRAGLPREASCIVAGCPSDAKGYFDVWGTTPSDLESMRGVKRALDPNNVLNRGRFLV